MRATRNETSALLLALLLVACWAATLPLVQAGTMGCEILHEDWSKITFALAKHDFYTPTKALGDCDLELDTSLVKRYEGCGNTLADAAPNDVTCESSLLQIIFRGQTQTSEEVMARVSEFCSVTLNTFVKHRLCNPNYVWGCPNGAQQILFAPFAMCHQPVLNMSTPDAIEYFTAKKELKCVKDKPETCVFIRTIQYCPVSVMNVFLGLYPDRTWNCESLFKGDVARCDLPFTDVVNNIYCPAPTILEKYSLMIILICTLVPAIVLCGFCGYRLWYRADHISHMEILNQSMLKVGDPSSLGSSTLSPSHGASMRAFHPEMHAAIAKYSKFKGVQFDTNLQKWTANGVVFADERDAAKAAYLQSAQMFAQKQMIQINMTRNLGLVGMESPPFSAYQHDHSSSSPPNISQQSWQTPTSPPSFHMDVESQVSSAVVSPGSPKLQASTSQKPTLEQYKAQLVDFYNYWDPDKPDVVEHVNNLFARHNIAHVKRAVQAKYGVCPPGWDVLD